VHSPPPAPLLSSDLSDRLADSGELVASEGLANSSLAHTVAVRNGQTLTTDGPFAEVKEHLAGFYLIEVESFDRAVQIAARSPAATKVAISSDRFTPLRLARLSVLRSSSASSETLIFLAPLPIFGRPGPPRSFRSWARSAGVIGRVFSKTNGLSNSLVARESSAALISSGCLVAGFIAFSGEISVSPDRSTIGCALHRPLPEPIWMEHK